ncbi:Spore coat polysaccharide biosynthesis protein SpsG, predicted glycosyltransferase [Cryobacterium flavum]|nr:Spore coat polysaccharide biosynthesis protein SpsG, predicted glycosyltransferase [Cryobacterium flavum]
MHVLVRCDASKEGGVGHLIRSMSLIDEAISRGWDVSFSGDVTVPFGRDMLKSIRRVPAEVTPDGLAEAATKIGADVVHVDHYGLIGDYRASLNDAGILLSSMEDTEYGRRAADLVVDPSPSAAASYRPDDGSDRILRGASFVPLRQSVRRVAASRHVGGDQPDHSASVRIVVMLGGTDALNATAEIMRVVIESGLSAVCSVIVDRARWSSLPSSTHDVKFVLHEPSAAAIELFHSADFAVSAAGTSLWELLCMGVPTALIQLVDNQRDNYQFVASRGLVVGLGPITDVSVTEEARGRLVRTLGTDLRPRVEAAQRGQLLVDGLGSERIVSAWESMLQPKACYDVRDVSEGDASLLFDWRNDAMVRAASRETRPLEWTSHHSWVLRAMEDPDRHLLLVTKNDSPVATVRFDLAGPPIDAWEVSIVVAPSLRGQGLGSDVLAAAEEYLRHLPHRTTAIYAAMRRENHASASLFRAAGYEAQENDGTSPLLSMRKLI